jgi:multidrug efflux pump subunit AcrA (membrane-fusion protein)
MLTKYLLPLLAVAGVVLAVYTVAAQNKPQPVTPPVAEPASSPYETKVPGAGLVEPSTEFIAVGTHVPGVVTSVHVKAGDRVKAGDPLFGIDDRTLRADLAARETAVRVAQAQLEKLLASPRPEDVPPAEARVREAESQLADLKAQLAMWENLPDKRAVSAEELSRRRFGVATAEARLAQARSELALIRAGAWGPDVEIAKANVAAARSEADRVRTELERLTVRAPVEGEVLKVNVRPGEFAPAGPLDAPLMTLGETSVLHVRVDIDENDAWRVRPGAKGRAFVRGNSKLSVPITFVRFEPYVIPKRSLTGASGERVDTRVLQVIYAFRHEELPMVFVGQQMDVYIEAPGLGDAKFGTDAAQAEREMGSRP